MIATTTTKRFKPSNQAGDEDQQHQPILPGLPDHLAQLCLSHVHPSLLYSVCLSWRRLIYSPSFPPFLSLYALLSSTTQNPNQSQPDTIQFSSFDPISSTWHPLPPPPYDPDLHRPLLLRHPSFIARNLPIQTTTVDSTHLVLLAATTHHLLPALSHPLTFNPISNKWRLGPPFSIPRRWCATGSVRNSLYIASGVGSGYTQELSRSTEKWDLKVNENKWGWEQVTPLKHGRFSREAVEAVGWRGKLCMVNVRGNAVKEGVIYDVEKNLWEEMTEGMLIGWNGPAASMDEDVIYVVDEGKGVLSRYDSERDSWVGVVELEKIKGAVQIAAGGGRVCVVCSDGAGVVVVDVVTWPVRVWVVGPPEDMEFLAVHVLPRMSSPET